jgi:hypothetical protein
LRISRRDFVGGIAAGGAALWSAPWIAWNTPRALVELSSPCVLFGLNAHCVLEESLRGYQDALHDKHQLISEARIDRLPSCGTAIVPGLGRIEPSLASSLTGLLESGTNVILESAAAFLSPKEFASHQEMLNRYFGIAVGVPVPLWPSAKPARRAAVSACRGPLPYVDYGWPRETKVRDFSWVVPVSAGAGDVIGTAGGLSVAVRNRNRRGTLIFLGSPLGPALRAGDPEAQSWLHSVLFVENPPDRSRTLDIL